MTSVDAAAQDTQILVGPDPYSDSLIVMPLAQARADVSMIAALAGSTTFGEVRRNADAWAEVQGAEPPAWVLEELGPAWTGDVKQLADDTPFEWESWFGESYYLRAPLARLETAKLCPEPVMEQFGREDDGVGFVDYEPARWLSPEDQDRVEARLVELGVKVVHDPQILEGFNY